MFTNNAVCELLGIRYPVLQGGMAWVATAELAAAVSKAGGLGVIGSGQMPPDVLRAEVRKVKLWTDEPFGVNVMLMTPFVREIMQVIVEEKVPVVTTGAGNPGEYVAKLKDVGTRIIPVVASVALAKRLERLGVDAVIAEGTESGGHIGDLATMCLVPQIVDAVKVPVIAAGGITDERGMMAAFALGAKAIQMGTRFVASYECTAHEDYKQMIIKAKDRSAVTTGLSTGHPVRVLDNNFAKEYTAMEKKNTSLEEMEKYGVGRLRLAVRDGDVKHGSVMAGQVSGMINNIKSCEEIIQGLVSGFEQKISEMYSLKK